MKNTNWIIIVFFFLLPFYGCEDEASNPGDFSLRSELEVIAVFDTIGNRYEVEILRSVDTTYVYYNTIRDTLKDETGKPILDAYGKPQVTERKEPYVSNKTAKYYELKPILLESPKTELQIEVNSNARWQAPMPDFGNKIAWFKTQTNAGGGNSTVKAEVLRGLASNRRPVLAEQYIFTRDSTVLFKLTFDQKAMSEN
jgi:hypothetical protein